ncbi:MAG: type 3 domain protein [Pedosphaera sp.]|nr:type 3 domain protein [Pedosphaera sp.]
MISGLILAAMLSAGVMAQGMTGEPPALPTPGAAPAPAPMPSMPPTPPSAVVPTAPADLTPPAATNKSTKAASAKKKTKKKAASAKKPVNNTVTEIKPAAPLIVNEPAVARQNNVNVRGKANINSEVVMHLKEGETVTVLEEITLKNPKTDEPTKWAKISLPPSAHVWVNSSFLDANKAVKPVKLNLRTGAGENYSVIGLLHKGDTVKEVSTKGDWSEIEAPTNAFAFVAAHLLTHKEPGSEPAVVAAVTPPPAVPPTVPSVVDATPTVTPPTEPPAAGNPPAMPTPPAVPIVVPTVPAPLPPPVVDEPPPKRVVEREGIVRGTVSIQAPTHYQLQSLDDGKVINYLYSTSTNLVMKRYNGRTVLVTGEEGLDERWPNTPVITIQKIQVVE